MREPGQTGSEAVKSNNLSQKKICPTCGATRGVNETVCVCGASLDGKTEIVQNIPIPKGKQGNPLDRQVAAQIVMPTNSKVVTRDMPESMNRRVKRLPNQELSDEFVDSVSNDHLDQVQRSAENLGL